MVIALLLAISAISLTGYMMTTDTFWGVGWVEDACTKRRSTPRWA
jgi:cytochrome b